jgi:hypothetical protein
LKTALLNLSQRRPAELFTHLLDFSVQATQSQMEKAQLQRLIGHK